MTGRPTGRASGRPQRYWLRPGIATGGEVVWDVIEAPFRPSPESLGPWKDAAAAVLAAEPDGVRVGGVPAADTLVTSA